MQIETKVIRGGGHIGDTVWICHYNRPDLQKKALRNIPPTKAVVTDNCVLPANKTVYYSETHFVPLNKAGKPLKKVISPVDNTGFRSRLGNELFVFTTEDECKAKWNSQLRECCGRIDDEIANAAQGWIDQKVDLTKRMTGTD